MVCTDPSTLEQIAFSFDDRRRIQLRCIPGLEAAHRGAELEAASLVILDVESATQLQPAVTTLENAGVPAIFLAREQHLGPLLRTLPVGGAAILPKPVDRELLLAAVDATLRREIQARTLAEKYFKMRQLVRRVVRERRDINRRVELVCRDLVEAHRQLTFRFVELQQSRSADN